MLPGEMATAAKRYDAGEENERQADAIDREVEMDRRQALHVHPGISP